MPDCTKKPGFDIEFPPEVLSMDSPPGSSRRDSSEDPPRASP